MDLATGKRRLLELRRIEAALTRIEAGEYGYCTVCGEEIAARRLELDPSTPTCIGCAIGSAARG